MKMAASTPALGIRRSRPTKHRPKRFLRKLVNYLKSDSYMFAPIISPSASSSSKRKYSLSPREVNAAAGFETGEEGYGEEKKKKRRRLVEAIGEFLRTDSYMYALLFEGDCFGGAREKAADPASEGTPCLTKRVTTSIARTVLTRETTRQPTEDSSDAMAKGQTESLFDTDHALDNGNDQTPKQGESLKQVVFPSCWKSVLSESDFPSNSSIAERVAHRRKIPVE